ncbi:chorismate mutase [Thalassospira lucentensis]
MPAKANHCETMSDVRENVDRVDRLLVALMAERLNYIEQAARIKPSSMRSVMKTASRM